VVFAVEGGRPALCVARRIARELGGVALHIEGRDKPAYHAAGAMVAGHMLGLVEASMRILMRLGFTRSRAVRALLPLVRQTLDNFERIGPAASWTGPVSRGDYLTVARHAAALESFPPEYGAAYAALARLGAAVLARRPRETLKRLGKALKLNTAAKESKS